MLTVEVLDPIIGMVECRSGRLNQSPGILFYTGMVYSLAAVKAGKAATIPTHDYAMVVTAIEQNGGQSIIHVSGMVIPFDTLHDQEL